MIYTLILLKKYKNFKIPCLEISLNDLKNLQIYLNCSNNDRDIMSVIKYYFYNHPAFLIYIIIWKNFDNYYINNNLINYIILNKNEKRFIFIKISIIISTINGKTRHANIILIDNNKKIVERFEPYGELLYSTSNDLNFFIKKNICDEIGYEFNFVQSYPGFQSRSNEFENLNRSYGDPGGFCLAWCFLYLEVRLKYSELGLEPQSYINLINNYIINIFSKDFKSVANDDQQNIYLTFIRYYAKKLDTEKNNIIKSYNVPTNIIYHINLNNKNFKKIINKLNHTLIKLVK